MSGSETQAAHRRYERAIACAIAALAVFGACSSYRGTRFSDGNDADPTNASDYSSPTGVPYYLSKPQFLVTASNSAAGPTNATVSFTMVQDRSQAYAVRLEPGWFSTPTFKLVFNSPGGTINSVSSTTAEQITPTITALGSFVVALAGAVPFHSAAKGADLLSSLQGALKKTAVPSCLTTWDYISGLPSPVKLNPAWIPSVKVAGGLLSRLAALQTDDDLQSSFSYLTVGELKCLTDLAQSGEAGVTDDLQAFLITVTNVKPARWRALFVNYVDGELRRIGLLELQEPDLQKAPRDAIEAYRARLQSAEADAIGAHDLYVRANALHSFLDTVKYKDVRGGTAPAAAEYVQYRAEFDTLNASMATLKATTLAALQTTPPAPMAVYQSYQNTPICSITHTTDMNLQAISDDDIRKNCHGTPDYVVVLDPQ